MSKSLVQNRGPLGQGRVPVAELTCLADVVRGHSEPLEQQIVTRLRAAIAAGQLVAGARVPPSRRLAVDLGVARNTVAAAYEQLVADGYLIGAKGAGTFVVDNATPVTRKTRSVADQPASGNGQDGIGHVSICRPASSPFPLRAWRRAFAGAASRLPGSKYGDPAGERRLREAIVSHLRIARALPIAADQIVVTAGAGRAVALLAQVLLRRGDVAAMEDPGWPVAAHAFADAGAKLLPVPVDRDGLVVDRLPNGPDAPRLVYVTPSHQFPLGVRLSLARRHALLAWAAHNDAFIVEDDYDGEFRYDASPLPPLASLPGSERVAYVGTFSKTLTPALRLGYAAVAPTLGARLIAWQAARDDPPSGITQHAVAMLMEEGVLSRHIARMRRLYAAKRAELRAGLEPLGNLVRLSGLSAGLHVCLGVPVATDIQRLCAALREEGIAASSMADFAMVPACVQACIVVGYGAMVSDQIQTCCTQIRSTLSREPETHFQA